MATHPTLPAARIETLQNALIVPTQEGRNLPSGVFCADGTFCATSRTQLSGPRLSDIPEPPRDDDTLETLPGRHLFGGIARQHFGHFLVETIARLWALDHLDRAPESILFVPMYDRKPTKLFGRQLAALLQILIGDIPAVPVLDPARVGTLLVPSQGVGHLSWSTGTPEFRRFVRARLESGFVANGPEKLYISRARLDGDDKLVDHEADIEEIMASAGYTIFHPERYSITQQIEHYLAAKMLVGADGSAFHLAAHLLQPGTRVALIKRRHRPGVFAAIAAQIKAFGEVDLTTIHALLPQDDAAAHAPLKLGRLRSALTRKGFI
jgi:capsular polysaccharide biosynthesis protein